MFVNNHKGIRPALLHCLTVLMNQTAADRARHGYERPCQPPPTQRQNRRKRPAHSRNRATGTSPP